MDEFAAFADAAGSLSLGRMCFRLFRSRVFWFGVPALLFLVWAWWDSHFHYAVVGFKGPGRVFAGHLAGYVFVAKAGGGAMDWRTGYGRYFETPMAEGLLNYMRHNPDLQFHELPYGIVILGYLAAWSGLVIWRARTFGKSA
jgi:hypothetical protein